MSNSLRLVCNDSYRETIILRTGDWEIVKIISIISEVNHVACDN